LILESIESCREKEEIEEVKRGVRDDEAGVQEAKKWYLNPK
jgi:hypothetical protein